MNGKAAEFAEGKFPRTWLPGAEDRDARVLLHHRQSLVEMRTRAKNGLHALALSQNLSRGGSCGRRRA